MQFAVTATFSFSLTPVGGAYPGAASFSVAGLRGDGNLLAREHCSQRRSADGDPAGKDGDLGKAGEAGLLWRRFDCVRSSVAAAGGHQKNAPSGAEAQPWDGSCPAASALARSSGRTKRLRRQPPFSHAEPEELHQCSDSEQRLRATHSNFTLQVK